MTGRAGGDRGAARDRGAGSVLMLAVALSAVLLTIAAAALGQAVIARHRAQTAADLAALAGASAARSGAAGCQEAARVAAVNGTRMESCRAGAGGIVEVLVSAGAGVPRNPAGAFPGGFPGTRAYSHARAGPPCAAMEC